MTQRQRDKSDPHNSQAGNPEHDFSKPWMHQAEADDT